MEYHIEEIIPKLNKAGFVIWSVRPYLSYEVVRIMYFSYFITFWGIDLKIIQDSNKNN